MASAMPLEPATQAALAAEGRTFVASSPGNEDLIRQSLSDGQYEYAAFAAACAAQVSGIPARSLHNHVHGSWTRDQTGRNRDFQLLTAGNRGAQGLPVDDNYRRRNKLAAVHDEHSTLLHLSKIHRAGRE